MLICATRPAVGTIMPRETSCTGWELVLLLLLLVLLLLLLLLLLRLRDSRPLLILLRRPACKPASFIA